jgi:hypothetical protein
MDVIEKDRRPIVPAYGTLANGLVAVHKDYRLHEADPATAPAHQFASWASMRAFAIQKFGAKGFDVFVGPDSTRVYCTFFSHDWHSLVCAHHLSDESRVWKVSLNAGPLSARQLHELLNSAEDAIVDAPIREKLRLFASKRVVKGADENETQVSDTGTTVLVQGRRGESVDLDLPKSFDIALHMRAPFIGPFSGSLRIPVFPWSEQNGLSFRTHVDIAALVHRALYECVDAFFASEPVYFASAQFTSQKRV